MNQETSLGEKARSRGTWAIRCFLYSPIVVIITILDLVLIYFYGNEDGLAYFFALPFIPFWCIIILATVAFPFAISSLSLAGKGIRIDKDQTIARRWFWISIIIAVICAIILVSGVILFLIYNVS